MKTKRILHLVKTWDAGANFADRYTVCLRGYYFTMSENADKPNGICQAYFPDVSQFIFGTRVNFFDLPTGTQKQIEKVYSRFISRTRRYEKCSQVRNIQRGK